MKKLSIIVLTIIVFNLNSYSQKANVTSAVLEYRKYNPYMGDFEGSAKAIDLAKKYIDLAYEHPETKEDEKMIFHRGAIYYCLIEISQILPNRKIDEKTLEEYFTIAKTSLTKVYQNPKGKFKTDADDFVKMRHSMVFNMGLKSFEEKKYNMAGMMFVAAYQIKQLIGVEDLDAKKNALVCMSNEIVGFSKDKMLDSIIDRAKIYHEAFPKEIDPLKILFQTYYEKGDKAESEKVVKEAIEINPNDKTLFYSIGTIYMEMKQYDIAEINLQKAIQIDPEYIEALYQLGAYYVEVAGGLKDQANQLKFGDPKYDEMITKSDDYYKKALVPLEAYITKQPKDKDVLNILFQIYKSLKNTEKALEYKKRAEEIK
ncbi:MAG: hypothetical protein HYU67_02420 [Flavobacteriia bacterium]|nr:hypothetical protein [Flavobacteriia bacterium]